MVRSRIATVLIALLTSTAAFAGEIVNATNYARAESDM